MLFANKPVNSPKPSVVIAKGDSAATHNYWREKDKHCLTNITKAKPCQIILPNAAQVHPSQSGQLPLSKHLSAKAKDATIVPQLKSSSLISLGKLCDDGCNVLLNKKDLKVFKNTKLILKGHRNLTDGTIPIVAPTIYPGLCKRTSTSPLTPVTKLLKLKKKVTFKDVKPDLTPQEIVNIAKDLDEQKAHAIIRKKQTKRQLPTYLHATCLSPTVSTFTKAINKLIYILARS